MTDFRNRYQAGVNLGGWISQYGEFDYDHFEHFITESDIATIASWGMDHVRLPIDYPVLAGDAGDDGFNERGFGYIDDCLQWCRTHDLDVILDLHEAPGYSFSDLENNRLFDDAGLQDEFVDVWREMATRYTASSDEIVFELLNEVVEPTSDRWNALVHRTVDAIREVDDDRTIIIGGNNYNAIDQLEEIDLVEDDENIVYTFHFYQPHLFTHQHASWSDAASTYDTDVEYPGTFPGLAAFLEDHPEYSDGYGELVGERIDREWLEAAMQPAVDFRRETSADVYCGEYGVIEVAPEESRLAWYRDVVDILRDLDIGRGCWSYKEMDFGLVDDSGTVVNEELVEIVSQS